ncbi:MAG: DUF128 domain-containing protein [Pirellulaceae bacterium]
MAWAHSVLTEVLPVMEKTQRHRVEILQVLSKLPSRTASARITRALESSGHPLSERTVRLYLRQLEEEGLTESRGRQGHLITEQGLAELRAARVVDGVGFLSAKIDQMTFNMSFDLATRTGSVVVNVSLVDPQRLAACAEQVCEVFAKGYAMGNRVALLSPGETMGQLTVPADCVGFCTICSITLNGVLLKHGIPTNSRFGGLLELRAGCPTRFVEIIYYDGTTIDPLEVFIRSHMTDYLGAIRTGHGLIGASFRELPADSREMVLNLSARLTAVGLGGLMEVGLPGQAVLGQAVHQGRLGAVIVGGLNPIAILEELDHRVESRALAGLLDYHRLFPFEELSKVLRARRG